MGFNREWSRQGGDDSLYLDSSYDIDLRVLMIFKGLHFALVSLSRFVQYSSDHSFWFLYFCFVLYYLLS